MHQSGAYRGGHLTNEAICKKVDGLLRNDNLRRKVGELA